MLWHIAEWAGTVLAAGVVAGLVVLAAGAAGVWWLYRKAPLPRGGPHQHRGEVCATDRGRRGCRTAGAVAAAGGARPSPAH
jgi:hypothetical protein